MTSVALSFPSFRGLPCGLAPLSPDHLYRPKLLRAAFKQAFRLRLLCAPFGFGKSALLNEITRELAANQHCLWFALDRQPLTSVQFRARLSAALNIDDSDDAVAEHLATLAEPLYVVIDDLPLDPSGTLEPWIERLLLAPGSHLQLIVGSRHRPHWNLPRLFLEGELLELGPFQLAFGKDEFDTLVQALAPGWPSRSRDELWQQTHGWCAGVRLMLNNQDTQNNWSWLHAYVQQELLGLLTGEQREVLLGLVHLPRVSAALCDSLWEGLDGAEVFRGLLNQSLLVPVEQRGGWYRIIPPIAHILISELSGTALNHLRLKACRAYVGMERLDEAIEQAVLASQPETAISLMDRLKFDWIFAGRNLKALMSWRAQLPTDLLDSTPRLIGLHTRALLVSWRVSEAQACLEKLSDFLPAVDPTLNRRLLANWQAMRGNMHGLYGHSKEAVEHCQSALANLDPRDWRAAYLCYSTLARLAIASGAHSHASTLLEQATEQARRQDCLATELLLNTEHIRLCMVRGESSRARLRLEESFLLLDSNSAAQHSLLLGRLLTLRGEMALMAGDLPGAEQALLEAKQHTQANDDPMILHALLALAEVAGCQGDEEQARRHILDAERYMHRGKVPASLYQIVIDHQQARLLVREGDWEQLLSLARSLESRCQNQPVPQLPFVSPALRQRCQLLLAMAEQRKGKREEARARLLRLVVECEKLHFVVLHNEVLATLARLDFEHKRMDEVRYEASVRKLSPYSLFRAWVGPVLSPASPGDSPLPTRPHSDLTPKEQAVLQLLAAGLSNQEIGEHLFISLNTVKTHTRRINTKLGVKRRTQAVARAQTLGML